MGNQNSVNINTNGRKALAGRALEACRNQLLFENRFLEQALFRLKWNDSGAVYFGSEGGHLIYSDAYVLERYVHNPQQLILDYLHTIMHCLYQHPFFASTKQQGYWNLASDIAIECLLEEIDDKECLAEAQYQLRHGIIETIKSDVNAMSAQKIYTFLIKNAESGQAFSQFSKMGFDGLCLLFKRDEHSLWYPQITKDDNAEMNGQQTNTGHKGGDGRQQLKAQQMWKEAARHVLMEAQSFAKPLQGKLAGNMIKNLQKLTRENYDYSEFLSKFAASLEERTQTDLEEFDYIYYTYGLKLLGQVPLVEPLEYKEKYLLREFVIAIDTSASCEKELVKKFLTKTYGILCQAESFTAKVNIHIIQCDAAIQDDIKIKSQKDLEAYISNVTLKGLGGTDFCPVFEYIDHLLVTNEMRRVEGLVYFTDGYGRFPAKTPRYKTAFVFLNRDEDIKVPAWAMKVYLDEEAL